MAAFDLRIVEVSIEVNNQLKTYSGEMDIKAIGMKYANPLQNECVVNITNLDKETRNYLLTETSPFNLNRTPKILRLSAGRESFGTSVIFEGNIVSVNMSQPPDIVATIRCLTGNFLKGNVITRNQSAIATHQQICEQIARDTNTILNYQATSKNISNYAFSGGALEQLNSAEEMGDYSVFIDNNVLVVKDRNRPLNNEMRILSEETGLVGIPELTEHGIRVRFLIDNKTVLGGAIEIRSRIYQEMNGVYVIYKLGFQISSQENPFYYIAEASRIRNNE